MDIIKIICLKNNSKKNARNGIKSFFSKDFREDTLEKQKNIFINAMHLQQY